MTDAASNRNVSLKCRSAPRVSPPPRLGPVEAHPVHLLTIDLPYCQFLAWVLAIKLLEA